jgi:predicted RNA-binding Zn-ribbon protein involved in translation (DUF1610 family)
MEFKLPPSGFKRLFYDIETSFEIGKFWRPSWKAVIRHSDVLIESAIICISYKWEGQKKVHSLQWDEGCDKALLSAFMEVALLADECIAHNGDNFDEKIIRTRCLFHGVPCPPRFKSLDTLKKARSHFKFDSNTLEYIAKRLTGDGKTPMEYEDWNLICLPLIPRHLGYEVELPDTYHKALKKMVKYCEVDVLKLEEVFHYIQPYITHNSNAAVATGGNKYDCPKCGGTNTIWRKNRTSATGVIKAQFQCKDKGCYSFFTVSNKTHMTKLADEMAEKARKQ